jgi:hypothetical protein
LLALCWGEDACVSYNLVCYPRTAGELCIKVEPKTEELAQKLGCEPDPGYPLYMDPSDSTKCCYGISCPGGRPFRVEGALTHAATTTRGDWG